MPFHIEELFYIIMNNLYQEDFITILPCIIKYNTISKIHNEWIKNVEWYKNSNKIITAYKWLKVQKLRKSVSKRYDDLDRIISSWYNNKISIDNIHDAVLLYNNLKESKIIGNYPNYNICYKYIHPDEIIVNDDGYESAYKNYPILYTICHYIYDDCEEILINTKYSLRKINAKDDQLYKDKPYLFRNKYLKR